jgi:hypothetical protein
MQNKRIDGLTINHSPTLFLEQKQMQALDAEEMELSFQDRLQQPQHCGVRRTIHSMWCLLPRPDLIDVSDSLRLVDNGVFWWHAPGSMFCDLENVVMLLMSSGMGIFCKSQRNFLYVLH